MDVKEIARLMRDGSARLWPTPDRQAKGIWHRHIRGIRQTCYVQMLAESLSTEIDSAAFKVAAAAILKAAAIETQAHHQALGTYIICLNEGQGLEGWPVARPWADLKMLIALAADSLDGGQPAEGQPNQDESLPADAPPVDMPPPNPTEQPQPLPASITSALTIVPIWNVEVAEPVKIKEKEYA